MILNKIYYNSAVIFNNFYYIINQKIHNKKQIYFQKIHNSQKYAYFYTTFYTSADPCLGYPYQDIFGAIRGNPLLNCQMSEKGPKNGHFSGYGIQLVKL